MEQATPAELQRDLIEEMIRGAARRRAAESAEAVEAAKRALQLAREQAYHRLAMAIDRPRRPGPGPGQLRLFPSHATLFEDVG